MTFLFWNFKTSSDSLVKSTLFNEYSFYTRFIKDLKDCKSEVIIESPYITSTRMELFYPIFEELIQRGVKIYIISRDPSDHEDDYMRNQATNEILLCVELGINIVLLKNYHHRKLAIIDKNILWEGSLNILSQIKSQEVMRRIEGKALATQMFKFLKLEKVL